MSSESNGEPPRNARFVSERIMPDLESVDFGDTPIGEPPLPRRFTWRGTEYTVDIILKRWKESKPDSTHGSGESYVRKHWFRVRTTSRHEMTIYFERQARTRAQRKARWWLYTVVDPAT
jgi:Domain of unknown function (DUF6504)